MSGLLTALLVGAVLSVFSGGVAYALCRGFELRNQPLPAGVWRVARLVAILPVLLAPAIYFLPEIAPAAGGTDAGFDLQYAAQPAGERQAVTPLEVRLLEGIHLKLFAAVAYCIGLGVALSGAVARGRWMERYLRETRPASPSERGIFDRLVRRLNVRAPEFRITPRTTSPFLTGWVPRIVAPESLFADPDATRFALTHELTHLRRGDERDRLLGEGLVSVFWFNLPLRWIEKGLNQAREIACDAESLESLGDADRKSYAAALINMMRSTAQPVSAFGTEDRRHREMRIKAILKRGAGTRPSASLLTLALVAAFLPVACAQTAVTERAAANPAVPLQAAPDRVLVLNSNVRRDDLGNLVVDVTPSEGVSESAMRNLDVHVAADPDADGQYIVTVVSPAGELDSAGRNGAVGARSVTTQPQGNRRVEVTASNTGTDPSGALEFIVTAEADPEMPTTLNVTVEAPEAVTHNGGKRQLSTPAAAPELPHSILSGRITSAYGPRPARPAGAPVFHGGTDIAAPSGTVVVAPGSGTVTQAGMGYNGSDAWGNTIAIDHGDGWETIYAHLDGFDVVAGDQVAAGQQIGRVGTTGNSTGPHVHVELHHDGERVDPAGVIPGLR
ncbi:peptidoglycan DD-metalloendopeptidase family protein [Maricaulis sp.]|uniref:peptidoglycan DD-metalloendopeptidase family protein n=1 Tax=Maricaulis sp. TaxID=1486257 RepID=UPI003A8DC5C5